MEKFEEKLLRKLSEIYIFLMIIIFPLSIDNKWYENILQFKWNFFTFLSITYIVSIIFVLLYFLVFEEINYFKKIKLSITHYLALIFLGINIISSLISPFAKTSNMLLGSSGRGEGLIVITLYVLSFIFVSLFLKFEKRYLTYFSISSILVSLVAILQYSGLTKYGTNNIGFLNPYFISTIGNVDILSALYCILLTISFYSLVFLDKKRIVHIISILLGFFVITKINVDSSKISFVATLLLSLPFVINNNKKLSNLFFGLGITIISIGLGTIVISKYSINLRRMNFLLDYNNKFLLYLLIGVILLILSFLIKKLKYDKSESKKFIIITYIIEFLIIILGLIFIYFYNFKSGVLYQLHEIMHFNFNDEFGTYRIFLWKRTIKIFGEYPILGSGTDTFGLRFMPHYMNDIIKIGELTYNDTAANVYLTMLINVGVIGLISYIALILSIFKNNIKGNNYSLILLMAIACYLIQDFFNLWVVLVTPIFWILLGINFSSLKEKI